MRGLLVEALAPEPLDRPSVPEVRTWLRERREERHLRAEPAADPTDQWTMPFAPQPAAGSTPTEVRPLPDGRTDENRPVPVREAAPYQQPAPVTPPVIPPMPSSTPSSTPVTTSALAPAGPAPQDPQTRILPAAPHPGTRLPDPWHAPPPDPSRTQRVLQLLGLGALVASAVAYAPYLGTALVGLVLLVLRTASVTRQRHGRRQMIRGRARWYDVPATTLSSPGYVLLAFFGAFADLLLALLCGLALFAVGYLAGQPPRVSLLLAGAAFAPALWWGPGSGRLREIVRGMVNRNARTEFGGWLLVGLSVLGSAVLVGLLLSDGPNWAPQLGAPWR